MQGLIIAVGVLYGFGFISLAFKLWMVLDSINEHTRAIKDHNQTLLMQSERLTDQNQRLKRLEKVLDKRLICTCTTSSWRYDDPPPEPDVDCPVHGM